MVPVLMGAALALFQANLVTSPSSVPPHYMPPVLANYRPVWTRMPSAKQFAAHYPRQAALARMDGRVILLCAVESSGRLRDCQVLSETPPGWGFGNAALSLSAEFRAQPPIIDGHAMGGFKLTIPLKFVEPSAVVAQKPAP